MIDLGGSPQLSTFWRRRLTMLAAASRSSLALSRSNLFWLGAAALLLMALPTIHFAAASEEDAAVGKGGARAVTTSSEKPAGKDAESATPRVYGDVVVGSWTVTSKDEGNGYLNLPVGVYFELRRPFTRKELEITPAQEKKLVEISQASSKHEEKVRKLIRKDYEAMSPQERIAKAGEFQSRLEQVINSEPVRKQIEQLLAKEQLSALRSASIGANGLDRLLLDRQLREKIGVTDQQKKELEQLLTEWQQRQSKELPKLIDAVEQKTLAVVTPEQWSKLERDIAAKGGIVPEAMYPSTELDELVRPDVCKRLGLTAEQRAKARKLFDEAQVRLRQPGQGGLITMSASSSADHGKVAEKQRTMELTIAEWTKKSHEAIGRILTKQQSAELARLVVRRAFLNALDMTLIGGTPRAADRAGLLRQIKITPEQWKDLCRLHDEKAGIMWHSFREIGNGVLKILSPVQQEEFFEQWSRTFMKPVFPAGKGGGSVAITVMGDAGEKDTTKAAEKPEPPRILPPKIDPRAAGAAAIKQFDANGDGKISGKELDKCPGLKAAIDQVDRNGDGTITAEEIAARIKAWQDSKLGRMSLGCRVTHNGKPLAGAEVKFVPEKFLGDNLKIATGKTNAAGVTMITATNGRFPGVPPGFYRVEITKPGEKIPAKYNTQTILGQEVALDAQGIREGIRLDLKY